jgi:ubiquitin conjugation factor E4 B
MLAAQSARRDKESLLQSHTTLVPTLCLLANETVLLFNFLSGEVKEAFTAADMVARTAQMLNYFLHKLTGNKSLELKVKDPQRFHFNPKLLLSNISQIYLHFAASPSFVQVGYN